MRALFSGHSLCSPLVAFFCCCLLNTSRGSGPPRSSTSAARQPYGAKASPPSGHHSSLFSGRREPHRQHFTAAAPSVDSPHPSMETHDPSLFQADRVLSTRIQYRPPLHPSPPQHPHGSGILAPHLHHDVTQSRTAVEASAKWAVYVQAKQLQHQQANKQTPHHLSCTQTHFPKHSASYMNIPGSSFSSGDLLVSAQLLGQQVISSATSSSVTDSRSHEVTDSRPHEGSAMQTQRMTETRAVDVEVTEHSTPSRERKSRQVRPRHRRHSQLRGSEDESLLETDNNVMSVREKAFSNSRVKDDGFRPALLTASQDGAQSRPSQVALQDVNVSAGAVRPRAQWVRDVSAGAVRPRAQWVRDVSAGAVRPRAQWVRDVSAGSALSSAHADSDVTDPIRRHRPSPPPAFHHPSLPHFRKRRHSHSRYLTHRHSLGPRWQSSTCQDGLCQTSTASSPSPRLTRNADTHAGRSPGSGQPTDRGTQPRFGNALYFSGQEVLRLKPSAVVSPGQELPAHHFTVELWIKPEGGQYDPAVIVALTDTCGGFSPGGYWSVGIRTQQGGQPHEVGAAPPTDARFFFSLKTARATVSSTLWAQHRYQPRLWTHLAATYDGHKMALFINGALLAVGREQSREIFPRAAASACKALTLGGVPYSATSLLSPRPLVHKVTFNFRGTVDEVRLWGRALSHAEVRQHVQDVMTSSQAPPSPSPNPQGPNPSSGAANVHDSGKGSGKGSGSADLYLYDSLQTTSHWTVEEGRLWARLVPSDLSRRPHALSISVPLCGQTTCDNPDVVLSYVHHAPLRSPKQVRYRLINLMNDNGSNPTLSKAQIRKQHKFLNRAFRPYHISFQLDIHEVRNSTLRQRLIMFGCQLERIGDGICNQECMHIQTGKDGGDCDHNKTTCAPSRKGNGHCDFECNKSYHDWDGGDCCLAGKNTHYTCYDPTSPYRAYVVVEELRQLVALRCDSHLNVFIAVFSDWSSQQLRATHLIGLATFPWENHVYSVQGGAVIQQQTFGSAGQMDSLVHEVGHILGLWHVHHGVSEVECGDPCAETKASLLLGDLCLDTAPTSHNVHCRDPGKTEDHCGLSADFTNTPYRNYMSYADDNCTDHFTEQQVARMHCYLDLVYQPWRNTPLPSPVPLPPKVVAAGGDWVTVAWLPPLGGDGGRSGSLCGLCDGQGALVQFAAMASSPSPSAGWPPEQATGRPDAEPCVPSTRAWLPEVVLCTKKTPCRLDLTLHVPVVAHTLTLWVTWNAEDIRRLRLVFEDGTNSVVKATPALCDMPFTLTLNDSRRLLKVQVYTRTPFTAIDALQVTSAAQHSSCQSCEPVTYRMFRQPPFRGDDYHVCQQTQFTDREVQRGQQYQYWVETDIKSRSGQPSPPLTYTHGLHFCGDGHVDSDNEECDDGNILSGDGCDDACHIEPSFHCKESPSMCYRHDGDGVCEDFERESSVLDCGFYTPPHYLDQWAHDAKANPHHQLPRCPARLAAGPPPRTQRCGPVVDPRTAWFPCGALFDTGNFWIEFYIARPVVATAVIVHVAADGRTEADPAPKTISVRLIKEDNSMQLLTPGAVTLDCRHKELHVSVVHDFSKPFYKSRGVRLSFRSANISIAAVRVRSYRYLDPVTLASCGPEEVYNPHTGICLTRNCSRAPCPTLSISHGRPLCTGQAEGDVCRVTCDTGYRPESRTMEMTCRGGHWLLSQPVACVPVDCGRPAMPGAVLTCAHGTTFRQNCTFHCQPPSSLHGSDNWIVCEEDGLWSTPRAQCLVTCPPPLHMQHVRILKKRCRSGALAVGSRCKMRCKRGYHVTGSRRADRRVFRMTCEASGSWSGGQCQRVRCPKFDPIFTGLISCTDDVRVASRCTLMCPHSHEAQIVRCNAEGQWNTPLQPCVHFTDVTCPTTDHISKLVLRCSSPVVGAQCAVSCPTPDQTAMFSFQQPGRRAPQWEVVHSITCTGKGQWFPPLDSLTCVEQCSKEFIGDKWCDAQNNRRYCQWDGGDCCQSTLGSKVKPFLESCGDACACKDPQAVENRGKQRDSPLSERRRKRGY